MGRGRSPTWLLVAGLFGSAGSMPAEPTPGRTQEVRGRLERMKEEIRSLNLINGLHLTPDQIKALVELARKADRGQTVLDRREVELHEALEAPLWALRSAGRRGESLSPAELASFHRVNGQIHDLEDDFREFQDSLGREALAALSKNQQEVLAEYKPCLAPPRSQTHPDRIGSSESSGDVLGNILDRARGRPDSEVRPKLDRFLEKKLGRARRSGGDPEAIRERIYQAIDKARKLDPLAYESQKEELIAGVGLEPILDRARGRQDLSAKAAKLLLAPAALPLLVERLQKPLPGVTAGPVDLGKIQPAPNCPSGACGVPEPGPEARR